jgi:polyisoprenoid-binding protein YceI
VATYPTMTFSSTSVKPTDADDFMMTGNLTIKNVTKPVKSPVHIIGHIPDDGGTRVGYEGKITIDRRDFGITDSRLMGAYSSSAIKWTSALALKLRARCDSTSEAAPLRGCARCRGGTQRLRT